MNFLLLFYLIFFQGNTPNPNKGETPVKAWIEVKGEVDDLHVAAKLRNDSDKSLTVNYVLNTIKKGYSGNSKTVQKGTCISVAHKTASLSESRMNFSHEEELTVSLKIYHDKMLIAQDSVAFHGYIY